MADTKQIRIMRKNFVNTVLVLFAIVGLSSLPSCSNSSDDDVIPSKAITKFVTTYTVTLEDNWYQFFDVKATCTTETGDTTVIAITENKKYSVEIPAEKTPTECVFKVIATPKENVTSVDESHGYLFSDSCNLYVMSYYNDNTTGIVYNSPKMQKNTIPGKNIKKWISTEHKIYSKSCTLKKD